MKAYLISPPCEDKAFDKYIFEEITKNINIEFFQLRPKYEKIKKNRDFIEKYHKELYDICKKKNIKFIVNDDIELAKKLEFDGVHLGQSDTNCVEARNYLGNDFVIGISCGKSIKKAIKAEKNGADYIALGPLFKSKTKKTYRKNLSEKLFYEIKKNVNIPITLIGGINHKNFYKLKILKPDNFAIINQIWNFSEGPVRSSKKFQNLLKINRRNL